MRPHSLKGGTTPLQASPSKPRFLLDENVKKSLLIFLISKEFDVVFAPKGTRNGRLAALCKSEERVLVTNDTGFVDTGLFNREKLFSIVWLKIPQDDTKALIESFAMLIEANTKPSDFEGKLVVLTNWNFKALPLPTVKNR